MGDSHLLKVDHICKSFKISKHEYKKVLTDVNFYLDESEIVTIMGPSGGGKSTFLKIVAGIIEVDQGDILFRNSTIKNNRNAYTSNIAFIFQDYKLIPHLTVLENVILALRLRGVRQWEQQAYEALEFNQIKHLAHSYPPQLSGGESQRVGIARAISLKPQIIFADEPTGNLDEQTATDIIEVFKTIKNVFSTSFVIVTHDKEMYKHSNRGYYLKNGSLVEEGAKV